jgi:hypothetical protein
MLKMVSAAGANGTTGTTYLPVTLVSSEPLGPYGAGRLATLLGEAPSLLLASLDLRRATIHVF